MDDNMICGWKFLDDDVWIVIKEVCKNEMCIFEWGMNSVGWIIVWWSKGVVSKEMWHLPMYCHDSRSVVFWESTEEYNYVYSE